MSEDYVLFPCDIESWEEVKICLKSLLLNLPDNSQALVEKLQYVYEIVQKHQAKRDVFDGLRTYLSKTDWRRRELFLTRLLPCIVQYALDIEDCKPADGLAFSKQNHECAVFISCKLAASVVACSILCIWPGRRFDRHSLLNSINFDDFFQICCSDPGQCAKLECILHYFEMISDDSEDLEGSIVFHRQILKSSEVWNISDWTKSKKSLTEFSVHNDGRIEDAGPNVLQVDFANRKLGGAVLGRGKVQEEIRFSICPELLAGMLFMEAMTEHEAITIHGFKNYSDYTGYSRGLMFNGTFQETAQRDCLGNYENYLCCIDALSFKRLGGPGEQYKIKNIVRELNKAYIGFNQEFLKYSVIDPLDGEYAGQHKEVIAPMSNVVESYFSTLSEEIFTTALQETLVSLHELSSSTSSSTATSHSSGQNGRTVHDPLDLVGASCDYARRRSSNLSDISSRRSSSAGSRRSSGTQLTSSECGSELEEYFQSYQARHSLKPSVIKEESGEVEGGALSGGAQVQDFASEILRSIFSQGVQKAEDMTPKIRDFSTQVPDTCEVVKPKAVISTGFARERELRNVSENDNSDDNTSFPSADTTLIQGRTRELGAKPKSQTLEVYHHQRNSKNSRHKSPVRWKEPLDDDDDKLDGSMHSNDQRPIGGGSILHSNNNTNSSKRTGGNSRVLTFDIDEINIWPTISLIEHDPSSDVVQRHCYTPDNIENFAQNLMEYIMYEALRDISEIHRDLESQQQMEAAAAAVAAGTISSAVDKSKKRVAGYVGGLIQDVWSHSAYNVRKHFKTQQEQRIWTSDASIDMDLDLKIYADDFVDRVLSEAVDVYRTEKREEQKDLESMWQKTLDTFKTDAKYFEAEFSRYSKDDDSSSYRGGRHYGYPKSRIQREMLRRRSLDETGRCLLGRVPGFRDITSFEKELLKSAGSLGSKGPLLSHFEKELLNSNPTTSELLFYSGVRRASEPAPNQRLSIDVGCPPSHLRFIDRRRRSSACSTTSREVILDWLNQSQRSSGSSGTASQRRQHRMRTTSSHLDWYAQDLLLEAFNDALKEIFGDVHMLSVETDSVNNSFSSSHSAAEATISQSAGSLHFSPPMKKPVTNSADICDTYIPIPTPSTTSSASNNISNNDCIDDNVSNQLEGPAHQISFSPPPIKKLLTTTSDIDSSSSALLKADQVSKYSAKSKHSDDVMSKTLFESGANLSSTPTEAGAQVPQLKEGRSQSMVDSAGGAKPKVIKSSGKERKGAKKFQESGERADDVRNVSSDRAAAASRRSPAGYRESCSSPSLAYAMMTGLCENLSNEVIEGARSSLTSQQIQHTGQQTQTAKITAQHKMPLATGNWGCGAYRGDPQIKALLQWAAASCWDLPWVHYYTFGDPRVAELEEVTTLMLRHGYTVGRLIQLVIRYCEEKREDTQKKPISLFQYIRDSQK